MILTLTHQWIICKVLHIFDTTEGVEVIFPPNTEVLFEPGDYHDIECWLMDGNVLYGTLQLIGSIIKESEELVTNLMTKYLQPNLFFQRKTY